MACCMPTMPAPTRNPIMTSRMQQGQSAKFLLADVRHYASKLVLSAPITAEGGRTTGISALTVLTARFITPKPVVRPGRDMVTCTATFLILLIKFSDQ